MLLNDIIYHLPRKGQFWIYNILKWYYRKPRKVSFRDLDIILYPTVFHPTLYLTTETFYKFLSNTDLSGGSVLELGCGSGVISLKLSKMYPGKLYASDINPAAVNGLKKNAKKLGLDIEVFQSDLLLNIPDIDIDTIIVNPPYFQKEAVTIDEYAFFAGPNYEYFYKLFSQLAKRASNYRKIYMILTDHCDLDHILNLLPSDIFEHKLAYQSSVRRETHFIYEIKKL